MDFTLHGISKSKIPAVAFGSGTTYFHRSQDVTQGIIKVTDTRITTSLLKTFYVKLPPSFYRPLRLDIDTLTLPSCTILKME